MTINGIAPRLAWAMLAVAGTGIAIISFRYLAQVGPVPPEIESNRFYDPWLTLHVAGAATALLVGSLQFVKRLRAQRDVHRWIGRLYVGGCALGGLSGLVLAVGSSAGQVATAGFGLLGLCWLATTAQGWRLARLRRFAGHREWMIRSWSLTLAAVTLRIYLPLIEPMGYEFTDGYRAISFLCWVPNLLIAELWIRLQGAAPADLARAGLPSG